MKIDPFGGDRGDWMQTFTGRAFYPLSPRAEEVDSLDIAHSLSLLCRYNGHVQRFYSVAEHCVVMSKAVSPQNALAALLHDATEAYAGDLIRPIKAAMPEYRKMEDRLATVICSRYDIVSIYPDEVKQADTRILLDERKALLRTPPQSWGYVEGVDPLGVNVDGWLPEHAEEMYLDRLYQLIGRDMW